MNSLDDFAALRPDVDPIDDAELERLWNEIASPPTSSDRPTVDSAAASLDDSDAVPRVAMLDFTEERPAAPTIAGRRRSLALFGAAAAVVLGSVGTVVLLAGRSNDTAPLVDRPIVSTSVEGLVAATPPVDDALGTVPQWRVNEPGWELTEFDEVTNYPVAAKLWAAVIEGDAAAGWVLVYPTSLDLDPPIAPPEGAAFDVLGGVSVDREPSDPANLTMNWGGYLQAEASQSALVARGRNSSSTVAHEALDRSGAFDMTRSWRYVFTGPDGEIVRVEVSGGGVPYFEDFFGMDLIEGGGAVDGIDEPGFLAATPARVIGRTGFWVTTIESDTPPTSSDWSADLIDLVELVPDDERIESPPEPAVDTGDVVDADVLGDDPAVGDEPVVMEEAAGRRAPIDALAIGDSVMLGAAQELIELGVVVDAEESRVFEDVVDLVAELDEQDRLPNTLVVDAGSNGTIERADLDEFTRLVADVDTVILVATVGTSDYAASNNDAMLDASDTADNIGVVEWDRLAEMCPGDCFEADGIHLTPVGARYYADLLAAPIGV